MLSSEARLRGEIPERTALRSPPPALRATSPVKGEAYDLPDNPQFISPLKNPPTLRHAEGWGIFIYDY